MRQAVIPFLIILFSSILCEGQQNPTPLVVIKDKTAYNETVKADARKRMVALKPLIPGLVTDVRYATSNNFTHQVLYTNHSLYLREGPANGLKMVEEELNKKGLALKLFDAYRPYKVTCKMWQLVSDRHYVSNPRNGSNHNRGLAVDVTIIDLKTGKELDMGTGYDNFTDSAHHDFYTLPAAVLANRRLLKQILRKYGFGHVPSEWWHYQWHNDIGYEVLDIDFKELGM